MSITVQKIKKIEPAVYKCLMQIPEARDNDTLLILKIWAAENPELRSDSFSFKQFANGILENKYSSADTITRARRKVQAEYPETRGQLWYKRHQEAEDTRKDINE